MSSKPFNRVIRFEIHAGIPKRAIDFYTKVFNWKIKKWEGRKLDYWLVETCPDGTADGINGGIVKGKFDNSMDNCLISGYVCIISVEDIDATARKIISNGGTLALPKFNLKGRGDLAYFKDTEGNVFAILEEV